MIYDITVDLKNVISI